MKQHHKKIIRLAEQCERQQDYRERMKSERRPDRDDIAQMVFYTVVKRFQRGNAMDQLEEFIDVIVKRLENQGFDKSASRIACDRLIEKYTKTNWKPRQKFHLNKQPCDEYN